MKELLAIPTRWISLNSQRLSHLWQQAVEPPVSIKDPEVRRRIRLFNGLLVLIILITIIVLVVRILIDPIKDISTSTTIKAIIMGLALALLIYILNRIITNVRLMNYLVMAFGYTVILIVALTSEPPHFEFAFLVFLPLFATILFSLWETFLVCITTLICAVVFIGSLPTIPPDVFNDLIVFIAITEVFTLFVSYQRNRLETDRQHFALESARTQLLTTLITNLSHDFRTPLSIINTSAYLLGHSKDSQKCQERVDQITQQTMRLNKILDDILYISRLQHVFDFSMQKLELNNLLRMIVGQFSSSASSRDIRIISDLDEGEPVILANQDFLHRAFANVIENALQNTSAGGSVTIRTLNTPCTVITEITDTGRGIKEADLLRIFDPFFEGSKSVFTTLAGPGWDCRSPNV